MTGSSRRPGALVARGTRSTVHAYGRGAVVKVPAADTADEWIIWEARYAEAARGAGAPVPELLGIEQIDGRPASVWERVDGTSLWQQVVDRPERAEPIGRLLADVQHDLFALVPAVGLPRQYDRVRAKVRRAAGAVDPGLAAALDLPTPAGSARLCHGDMHASNVLITQDGLAIVDWFDASRGEPVADVARCLLVLMSDGEHPPAHLPGADPATLGRLAAAYRARAIELGAIDPELLVRWQAICAVARIAEGVSRDSLMAVWRQWSASG